MFIDRQNNFRRTITIPLGGSSAALRRFRRRASAARLLAILAACSNDAPGPTPSEGAYALHELNGTPLPYDHDGLGCCTYLDGTLEMEGGRYAAAVTARNRNTSLVFTAMEWGTYGRRESALTFSPESVAVAPLLLDAGTLSGDTLRVAFGGEGPGSADQFQALYVLAP
jgi:hypothetical protein